MVKKISNDAISLDTLINSDEFNSDEFNYGETINHFKENKKTYETHEMFQKQNQKSYKLLTDELSFKKNTRFWSIIILAVLTIVLLITLFIFIWFDSLDRIDIDNSVLLALITAIFVNLFGLVKHVLKYAFSPTQDLMNFVKDVNNGKK